MYIKAGIRWTRLSDGEDDIAMQKLSVFLLDSWTGEHSYYIQLNKKVVVYGMQLKKEVGLLDTDKQGGRVLYIAESRMLFI